MWHCNVVVMFGPCSRLMRNRSERCGEHSQERYRYCVSIYYRLWRTIVKNDIDTAYRYIVDSQERYRYCVSISIVMNDIDTAYRYIIDCQERYRYCVSISIVKNDIDTAYRYRLSRTISTLRIDSSHGIGATDEGIVLLLCSDCVWGRCAMVQNDAQSFSTLAQSFRTMRNRSERCGERYWFSSHLYPLT